MAEGAPEDEREALLAAAAAAAAAASAAAKRDDSGIQSCNPAPLNLHKAEMQDADSAPSSPHRGTSSSQPSPPPAQQPSFELDAAKLAATLAAHAHLNGSDNQINYLHEHLSDAAVAGLAGLAGLQNAPLNLTMGSQQNLPQLILASGQLVQGIQGAQLLIPTSQGLATQTILAIPVSQPPGTTASMGGHVSSMASHTSGQNAPLNLHNMAQPLQLAAAAAAAAAGSVAPASPSPLSMSSLGPGSQPPHIASPAHSQASVPRHHSAVSEKQQQQQNGSALNGASLSTISRLASATGLTVTPTQAHPTVHKQQQQSTTQQSMCQQNGGHSPLCLSPDPLGEMGNQPTINQTTGNVVDGINLDEIKEFAKAFKLRRLSLGLTQTQVGQALSITEGPAYSQSAICSALATQMYCTAAQIASQHQAMFEKLDITPKSAQKIKPVLERWMKEAEERYKSGQHNLTEFIGVEPSKKRKRRTSFTPQALEVLNVHFERNTHPSGAEITALAQQLGYEREVIRIWFCNKRQALKNTVRMMSKSVV